MQGYNKVMSANPGVKTTELPIRYGHWLPDQALEPVRDVATANPDLNVVFSESDVMQSGIQKALQQAGVWGPGVLEGSYDGGMGTIKQMAENPNGPVQADASNQPWDQGKTAVQMALNAFNKDANACSGGTHYIETTVVTPENAKSYYKPGDTYVRAQ
jgi:ribose transport system substrate-binding protein